MTSSTSTFHTKELTKDVYALAKELELCLHRNPSPRLRELAEESVWKCLQQMFDIPEGAIERRIHHPHGVLKGTRQRVEDIGGVETVWKDEDGRMLASARGGGPYPPLYRRTQNHPLLSDLYHLDQLTLVILGYCGSPITPDFSVGPSPDFPEKLRRIARDLDDEAKPASEHMASPTYVTISSAASKVGVGKGVVQGWLKREPDSFRRDLKRRVCLEDVRKRAEQYREQQVAQSKLEEKVNGRVEERLDEIRHHLSD